MSKLVELVREYKEISDQLQELEKVRKNLRDQLIELLGREFEGKIENYVVKVNMQERTIFDSKKIYQEIKNPELLNRISKEISYPVVRVKELH